MSISHLDTCLKINYKNNCKNVCIIKFNVFTLNYQLNKTIMKTTNYTTNEMINDLLNEFDRKLESYIFQLRLSKNSLVACNNIVQVGDYTIGKNEDKTVKFETCNTPTQWSEAGVKQILSIPFKNMNGEIVKPIVKNYKQWYKDQIKSIYQTRKQLLSSIA